MKSLILLSIVLLLFSAGIAFSADNWEVNNGPEIGIEQIAVSGGGLGTGETYNNYYAPVCLMDGPSVGQSNRLVLGIVATRGNFTGVIFRFAAAFFEPGIAFGPNGQSPIDVLSPVCPGLGETKGALKDAFDNYFPPHSKNRLNAFSELGTFARSKAVWKLVNAAISPANAFNPPTNVVGVPLISGTNLLQGHVLSGQGIYIPFEKTPTGWKIHERSTTNCKILFKQNFAGGMGSNLPQNPDWNGFSTGNLGNLLDETEDTNKLVPNVALYQTNLSPYIGMDLLNLGWGGPNGQAGGPAYATFQATPPGVGFIFFDPTAPNHLFFISDLITQEGSADSGNPPRTIRGRVKEVQNNHGSFSFVGEASVLRDMSLYNNSRTPKNLIPYMIFCDSRNNKKCKSSGNWGSHLTIHGSGDDSGIRWDPCVLIRN